MLTAMNPKIFLTFDCEDFINTRSTLTLHLILDLLHEYNLRGLFFLTGHMAEKINNFPKILDLLEDEEIGYHSSAHSVRPTIIEYTDVKDYALARRISVDRETSHINPLTGECEGKGGIIFLKNLFPNKKIISFRAPAFCWSPPHLEALKELGIRFDFSADLSRRPISHKGITFYPFPILIDVISPLGYMLLSRSLVKYHLAVLIFHPNYFVNTNYWDSIFFAGNPKRLNPVQGRIWKDTKAILRKFELFLKHLSLFEKSGTLEIVPSLEKNERKQTFTTECVSKCIQNSTHWAKNYLGYNPRFIHEHFMKFLRARASINE